MGASSRACRLARVLMVSACCAVCVAALPAVSASEPVEEASRAENPYDRIVEFSETLKEIGDWDTEYENIKGSVNRLWQQNGWDGEPDEFARDVILEVAEIPPWEPARRMQVLNERFRERWDLTDRQAVRVQGLMWQEFTDTMVQHADLIMKQAREMIRARAEDGSFTSEQVAQWTRESEPLFSDLRQRAARVSEYMCEMLDGDQLKVFERDLESFDKRMGYIEMKWEAWSRGEWKPEDWGLQHTAKPAGGGAESREEASLVILAEHETEDEAIPSGDTVSGDRWFSHAPSTWYLYVEDAVQWYRFDRAQLEAAKSIHTELVQRARAYIKRHGPLLEAVPWEERDTHEGFETVRRHFAELKRRLDLLVTRAQLDKAGA
jgi:hypothetical protein